MIKWTQTSRLSIQKSLFAVQRGDAGGEAGAGPREREEAADQEGLAVADGQANMAHIRQSRPYKTVTIMYKTVTAIYKTVTVVL